MKARGWQIVAAVGVTLVLVVAAVALLWPREAPVERGWSSACYRTDGGDKWVCGSGGEFEFQSGATLDIQSGATTDFSSGIDLDGALLDLDADGDTSLQADTDDQIDVEISGADDFQFTANTFTVLAGSSLVNNGQLDQNDNIDQDGSADEVQLAVTGYTTQTSDLLQLDGGLTDVGGGTYEQVDGDDDLGIAGDLEVEGTADIASLELAGSAVSATAAEINEVAGIAVTAVYTISAEDTDVITVNVQLSDGNGDDEVESTTVWGFLSGDSGGDGIVGTAPTGGIAGGTDGTIVAEPVDNKMFLTESEADGDMDFVIEDNGDNSFYMVLIMPNGRRIVSGEIDFNAPM
jgi:hypothetical protein